MTVLRALALLLPLTAQAAERSAPFERFELIMWQDHSPAEIAGLRRLGFTGLRLIGSGGHIDPAKFAALRASGLPWYVENIGTDFLSPYHRYAPGKPVTWLFDAGKARLREDPTNRAVFERQPGLSDPAALAAFTSRLEAMVRSHSPHRPIYYSLADEPGIGDLAAAWDADISPSSLAAMRIWLRTQYADLAALNREWGTEYAEWDAVVPQLTSDALRRTDGNYAAWADFKAWMDVAFARAVRAGTDAVHRGDPSARAALEGAQIPGWGGYDYSLLAGAVDAMDIVGAGNAVELAQAFNPRLLILRTSFGAGAEETRAAWWHVLHGGRGTIVWDDANTVVRPDGSPTARGRGLAATAAAIEAKAGWLRHAEPLYDPVAVLYSQASFRTRWILDRRHGDPAWWKRDAAREYEDNAWTLARRQILRRLGALAVRPRILSSAMLEAGALQREGIKLLILPHAIALSEAEAAAITAFAAAGGTVLADTEPGLFNQHSRWRGTPPLDGIARIPEALLPDSSGTGDLDALKDLLHAAGVTLRAELLARTGGTAAGLQGLWFRDGRETVLAVTTESAVAAIGPILVRPQSGGVARTITPTLTEPIFLRFR